MPDTIENLENREDRLERFQALMKKKSMTLRDVSRESGVNYDALVKFRQGKVEFPRKIESIAKALGTTPSYILFGIN